MSLIAVGTTVAGASAFGVAGAIGGAVVGGGINYMMNRGGAPSSASAGLAYTPETLMDKLMAQSDPEVARRFYEAESNREYGRPAYARLEQELMQEAVEGTSYTVDADGNIITGYRQVETGEEDEDGNPIMTEEPIIKHVGKEYAGQQINQGGVANIIGGNQTRQYFDSEGNEVTKRAGFSEDGSFEGTTQLALDLSKDAQSQQVEHELGLVEKHGKRATEVYRDQGDIRGALDTITALSSGTAIPKNQDVQTMLGGEKTTGDLRNSMLAQALAGIQAGGGLTDRERRQASQVARSAMQARGRVNDFGGIMAEMEMNERYRRQRMLDNQNFAGQVMNADQAMIDRQTARDQLVQSGVSQDRAFSINRLQAEQSTSADPYTAILGAGRSTGAQAQGFNYYAGAESAKTASPNLYNPHVGMEYEANVASNQDTYNASVYGADQAKKASMIKAGAGLIETGANIYMNKPRGV